MPDRDDERDLVADAAVAAGKRAARRAIGDLLNDTDDRSGRQAKPSGSSSSRRNKLIAFGVAGLLIVLGLIGLVLSYWQWFLLLGLAGVLGLYAWYRVRKRLRRRSQAPDASLARATQPERTPLRLEAAPAIPPQGAAADAEAEALAEREIEDELAAMKARLEK